MGARHAGRHRAARLRRASFDRSAPTRSRRTTTRRRRSRRCSACPRRAMPPDDRRAARLDGRDDRVTGVVRVTPGGARDRAHGALPGPWRAARGVGRGAPRLAVDAASGAPRGSTASAGRAAASGGWTASPRSAAGRCRSAIRPAPRAAGARGGATRGSGGPGRLDSGRRVGDDAARRRARGCARRSRRRPRRRPTRSQPSRAAWATRAAISARWMPRPRWAGRTVPARSQPSLVVDVKARRPRPGRPSSSATNRWWCGARARPASSARERAGLGRRQVGGGRHDRRPTCRSRRRPSSRTTSALRLTPRRLGLDVERNVCRGRIEDRVGPGWLIGPDPAGHAVGREVVEGAIDEVRQVREAEAEVEGWTRVPRRVAPSARSPSSTTATSIPASPAALPDAPASMSRSALSRRLAIEEPLGGISDGRPEPDRVIRPDRALAHDPRVHPRLSAGWAVALEPSEAQVGKRVANGAARIRGPRQLQHDLVTDREPRADRQARDVEALRP